jgi:hypothetical protein
MPVNELADCRNRGACAPVLLRERTVRAPCGLAARGSRERAAAADDGPELCLPRGTVEPPLEELLEAQKQGTDLDLGYEAAVPSGWGW